MTSAEGIPIQVFNGVDSICGSQCLEVTKLTDSTPVIYTTLIILFGLLFVFYIIYEFGNNEKSKSYSFGR
jgi:hypothetical protein